jgi:hypothetical protein
LRQVWHASLRAHLPFSVDYVVQHRALDPLSGVVTCPYDQAVIESALTVASIEDDIKLLLIAVYVRSSVRPSRYMILCLRSHGWLEVKQKEVLRTWYKTPTCHMHDNDDDDDDDDDDDGGDVFLVLMLLLFGRWLATVSCRRGRRSATRLARTSSGKSVARPIPP